MEKYEQLNLVIDYLRNEDVLTLSCEGTNLGDGWVRDPFVEE